MVTRKQIGFVLDSFLLFLVALFIYALGRRSGKKKCEENKMYVIGGPPYPAGGILQRQFDFTETLTAPPIEFVYPKTWPEIGEGETVWIHGFDENVLPKGMFKKHTTIGLMGGTSLGDAQYVQGVADYTYRTDELLGGDDKGVTDRREEEDGYYDERQ